MSEFRSPDYPADAVVAQDPAAASLAPQVSLLLNRGEQATTYVMPDLIGTDGERARPTHCAREGFGSASSARSRIRGCRQAPSCGSDRRAAFELAPPTRSPSR